MIAMLSLDHSARRAAVCVGAVAYVLPAEAYEPVARLEQKYAAMDGAMRRWHALLEDAKAAAGG